ncbi:MAG TPA: bifunctional diaminohydroxyphosphoribosylaminopyrimidine deaminase/5-amino-6-(5-phosphoribosylamino)uracil reductase RibD, partial [Candidatus Nanoarchaeia archaeon]|nr:bifunctional diaminohydroxyphosphoribosylaminopyrimidine deaminase/5-amino-6-(5-phosphoribosylamino)uracil reductase RibD [Candidatus Nanoarchaeia archaeon]
TGIPYVTMKVAQSLDGKICTFTGDSQWISGEESRQYVHELRAKVDAVMVGIGTVLKDNPQLTARRGKNFTLRKSDRQPMRIIVDPQLAIPLHAQVLANTGAMVCCNYGADPDKHRALKDKGTTILEFNTVTIKKILQELGKREINHVLIEGGAGIYTQALEEQVVDEILCFIAPKLIGGKNAKTMFDGQGMAAVVDAVELKNISVQHMGGDLMVKGNIVREATHHVQ